MKAVFGVVSLLIALAVVAYVAKTQTRMRAPAVAGAVGAVSPQGETVASQAASIEDKARADVTRALQDGARRTEDADQ